MCFHLEVFSVAQSELVFPSRLAWPLLFLMLTSGPSRLLIPPAGPAGCLPHSHSPRHVQCWVAEVCPFLVPEPFVSAPRLSSRCCCFILGLQSFILWPLQASPNWIPCLSSSSLAVQLSLCCQTDSKIQTRISCSPASGPTIVHRSSLNSLAWHSARSTI